MSLVALVGAFTLVLPARRLQQVLAPLVSLAAGSLLGGALFHMLPEGFSALNPLRSGEWIAAGFTAFLALEQFLHWHHSHRQNGRLFAATGSREPMGLLILMGDGLHNFIGGLGIASTFLINPPAGVAAWMAAVAHEIPQELGDFGVLVHSGWKPRRALFWNLISALTFPLGALMAWWLRDLIPLAPLVLFAAGNFIYIAASDLVPEIKHHSEPGVALQGFACFSGGLLVMLVIAQVA
ncbi:ZIP family metal transporter [Synechococcus sp. CB0101]|uniref:ZIP family metal transporter n=1 Tax=Synechococcus sp. CB0101 TaxID=232348 RepID=UPI001AEF6683|nr:ZIP family metal transporter [Synechococcus sp. CB0101]